MGDSPKVSILLATYNGEAFLSGQLDSIQQQKHPSWQIFASDDGSTDHSLTILQSYAVSIQQGPQRGACANFLSLVQNIPDDADYYAFADQDDVWAPDKLERALKMMPQGPENTPKLYFARTEVVDRDLNFIAFSPLFKNSPNFLNALVQNMGGGNTMLFNRASLHLLRQTKDIFAIVAHDWWTYLLVSGVGGLVFYDAYPCLKYRQHGRNEMGSNIGFSAHCKRIKLLFHGSLKSWIGSNIKALSHLNARLSKENQDILKKFDALRRQRFFLRVLNFFRLGIYRQTVLGQLGLIMAVFFNKI